MSLIFLPCVAGPLASAFAPPVVWNPSDRGSAATLSNGNLTYTGTTGGSGSLCRATKALATGKAYFEVHMDTIATGGFPSVGLSPATATSYTINIGANGTTGAGWGWYAGQTSGASNSFANGTGPTNVGVSCQSGDVAQVAIDFGAGKLWFGKNNTWVLSGNPGTGSTPVWTGVSGTLFPAIFGAHSGPNPVGTARFKLADFTYTPPSGFSSWQGN